MLTVYSVPNCHACATLKKKLSDYDVQFKEQIIGQHISREEFKTRYPNAKTAPFVTNNGVHMTNESVEAYMKNKFLQD